MKYLLVPAFAIAILLSGCLFTGGGTDGQGTPSKESRAVSGFKGIVLNLPGEVSVRQGTSYSVSVVAQPNLQSLIETSLDGDNLVIKEKGRIGSHEPFRFLITTPELNHCEVAGSGSILVDDVFQSPKAEVEIAGSGEIKASFITDDLNSEVSGSGNIYLSGKAKEHESQINGSGKIIAPELETVKSSIEINGSGDADVFVTDELESELNGSGNISYRGNPGKVKSDVNGSGRVVKK